MGLLDNVIILLLIVGSFIAGKTISDKYHDKIISEYQYQQRLSAAERGVGYVAPPARKRTSIGEPFMDRLKNNGKAVQKM